MSIFTAAAQDEDGDTIRTMQARPQVNSPEIPEGWRLVPVEPTDDMLYDIQEYSHILPPRGKRIWAHMLNAAPQPPALEQPQGEQQTRYLAGGARYKVVHLKTAGYCIHGLPREMLGQWVAFVDATDNKHMDSRQPQSVAYCHQSQPKGEQEPVAWQYRMRPDWGSKKDCWGPWQDCTKEQAAMYQRVPLLHDWAYESRQLYTHPQPKREPLTDEQINNHRLALPYDGEDLPDPWDFKQGVKAAERAHRIGGDA